jgi:hypothetical protein
MDQPESKLKLSDNFLHTSPIKFLLNLWRAFSVETQWSKYTQDEPVSPCSWELGADRLKCNSSDAPVRKKMEF